MTDEEVKKEGLKFLQERDFQFTFQFTLGDLFLAGYKLAMKENAKVIGLLKKLPSHIGRNRLLNDDGECIAYMSDDKDGDMRWLSLHNDGDNRGNWVASYGIRGEYVCLNPNDGPPYNNAFAIGDDPLEALQGLYKWCVENGFIEEKE